MGYVNNINDMNMRSTEEYQDSRYVQHLICFLSNVYILYRLHKIVEHFHKFTTFIWGLRSNQLQTSNIKIYYNNYAPLT